MKIYDIIFLTNNAHVSITTYKRKVFIKPSVKRSVFSPRLKSIRIRIPKDTQ